MKNQICAGDLNITDPKDACQGDSGGPIQILDKETGAYSVIGIVSYGFKCVGRGAYTEVFAFKDWILETMADN